MDSLTKQLPLRALCQCLLPPHGEPPHSQILPQSPPILEVVAFEALPGAHYEATPHVHGPRRTRTAPPIHSDSPPKRKTPETDRGDAETPKSAKSQSRNGDERGLRPRYCIIGDSATTTTKTTTESTINADADRERERAPRSGLTLSL